MTSDEYLIAWNKYCGKLYLIITQKNKMLGSYEWKYMAIYVAYLQELINRIEICAKLIKNLLTTPKLMTNASRENYILRFQPFALRLQIQMQK